MTTLLLQIERDHSPAYCALLCSYVRIARQTGALRTATLSSQSLVHCDRAGARVVCVSARDSMCLCAHGGASEARSRSPTAGPRGRQSRRHGTRTQACNLLRRTLPSRRSQACGVGRCQGGGRAGQSPVVLAQIAAVGSNATAAPGFPATEPGERAGLELSGEHLRRCVATVGGHAAKTGTLGWVAWRSGQLSTRCAHGLYGSPVQYDWRGSAPNFRPSDVTWRWSRAGAVDRDRHAGRCAAVRTGQLERARAERDRAGPV